MTSPKNNDIVTKNALDKSKWDEVVLKITSLPTPLIEMCTNIFASRNDMINCLKAMELTNEIREANFASKILQWENDSENLGVRVGETAKLSEEDSQKISQEVSALVRQAKILASENTQLRVQLKMKGEQKQGIHKRAATAVSSASSCVKEDTHSINMRHIELERISRARVRTLERELKELQAAHAAQTVTLSQVKEREIHFENRLRAMFEHVNSAKQKVKDATEERDKIQSSHLKSRQEEENFLSSLKETNAQLEISLKEQNAEATNTSKDLAAIEHTMKNLNKRLQCVLALVKIKNPELLSNGDFVLESPADSGSEPDGGVGPSESSNEHETDVGDVCGEPL